MCCVYELAIEGERKEVADRRGGEADGGPGPASTALFCFGPGAQSYLVNPLATFGRVFRSG